MKGDNKQYWTWVKNQRLKDIQSENDIGNPDRELMQILLKELREAEEKIKQYSE
tara:strand:- start:2511 stop:2672 length:162 start_codon:yes stop_codon:yes gene_type:complete